MSLLMTDAVRIGELCNLQLNDVQLDSKTIIVNGRTGSRLLPVTNGMVRLLNGWIRRRAFHELSSESPYVFLNWLEPEICEQAWVEHLKEQLEKLGLPRITPHRFRHAFCKRELAKAFGTAIQIDKIAQVA